MAHLSLKKKNVLIPRGKRQANKFSSLVEEFDGVPIEVPLLDFRPVKKYDELAKKLKKLHTYDWVIFTSQIAVETFFSFGPFDNKTFPKIAAIGTKTAEWLKEKGFETQDRKPILFRNILSQKNLLKNLHPLSIVGIRSCFQKEILLGD